MRCSVSMRGGRPPASSRAIADCVVPHFSASSFCDSPALEPPLGDVVGDLGEEPLALLDMGDALAQPLDRAAPSGSPVATAPV